MCLLVCLSVFPSIVCPSRCCVCLCVLVRVFSVAYFCGVRSISLCGWVPVCVCVCVCVRSVCALCVCALCVCVGVGVCVCVVCVCVCVRAYSYENVP